VSTPHAPESRRRVVATWFIFFAAALVLATASWLLHSVASTSASNHQKVADLATKTSELAQKQAQIDAAVRDVLAKLSTIQVHDQAAAAALKAAQADLQRLLQQSPETIVVPGPSSTVTRPGPTVTATARPAPTCTKRHCR
jgi:septal ring factor EnvC (AmiA/AmiB activator)